MVKWLSSEHSLSHRWDDIVGGLDVEVAPNTCYLIGDIVHSYFEHPYKQLTNDSELPWGWYSPPETHYLKAP